MKKEPNEIRAMIRSQVDQMLEISRARKRLEAALGQDSDVAMPAPAGCKGQSLPESNDREQ